jgi:hypothetical protein
MLLSWKLIVLAGLLQVLDLMCKALESTGAFVHLLMRKLHFIFAVFFFSRAEK